MKVCELEVRNPSDAMVNAFRRVMAEFLPKRFPGAAIPEHLACGLGDIIGDAATLVNLLSYAREMRVRDDAMFEQAKLVVMRNIVKSINAIESFGVKSADKVTELEHVAYNEGMIAIFGPEWADVFKLDRTKAPKPTVAADVPNVEPLRQEIKRQREKIDKLFEERSGLIKFQGEQTDQIEDLRRTAEKDLEQIAQLLRENSTLKLDATVLGNKTQAGSSSKTAKPPAKKPAKRVRRK